MNIPESDFEEIYQGSQDASRKLEGVVVLTLGSGGFLGQLFKRYIIYLNKNYFKKPCFLILVDNYIGKIKPKEIESENLISLDHDLTVPLGIKLADYKIDYIINFSGNASPYFYTKYGYETLTVSTIAINHLLELALFHKAKILNFSSSEVVAHVPEEYIPTDENAPICIHTMNPRLVYECGKIYIEAISWLFKTRYNLDCKVIRPYNAIGYGINDYRVVPAFMNKAMNNQPIEVFEPGTQNRSFIFFTDFFIGCLKVLTESKDVLYNIGHSGTRISMIDLARKIEKTVGKEGLVKLVPKPDNYKAEPQNRCPNIEKARKELGFEPKIGLDEALNRIYLYNKNQSIT